MILFYLVLIIFIVFGMSGFLVPTIFSGSSRVLKLNIILVAVAFVGIVLGLYNKYGDLAGVKHYGENKFIEMLLKQKSVQPILAKLKKQKFKLLYLTSVEPSNANNFLELAKIYDLQENYTEAVVYFKQAFMLEPSNYEYAYSFILANFRANNGKLDEKVLGFVNKDLTLQNNLVINSTLLGLHNFAEDNYNVAMNYLNLAIDNYNEKKEPVPFKLLLDKTINIVKEYSKKPMLNVVVTVDKDLIKQIDPNDIVFITAKAPNNNMPVAVKKLKVLDLDNSIKLTVKNAMSPEWSLEKVDKIIVEARISRSGDAIAKTTDICAKSDILELNKMQAQEISLLLQS